MLHGDLVIARTTVKSNKANNEVAKVCYAVRGSFQIIRGTGHGGYIVRKLNKPASPEFKFMSLDLYILPPSLKSCDPVDESDTRYLNQSHAPIVDSLKKPLIIELYNENSSAHPLPHSLRHSNTIMIHYPFLQLLQLSSLVFPNFVTKQILLLQYHFSKMWTMMIIPLLHQQLYINHSFIQTVYSLFNILQRIHLNLVVFCKN